MPLGQANESLNEELTLCLGRFLYSRFVGAMLLLLLSFVVGVVHGSRKQQKLGLLNGWLAYVVLHKSFLEEFFA
jgi:hypothetical protein